MTPQTTMRTAVLLLHSTAIVGTQASDDDEPDSGTYSSDSDYTVPAWLLLFGVLLIIKAAIVWCLLRLRDVRLVAVIAHIPCPERHPGQIVLYPTAPGPQVPYGTPLAASGHTVCSPQIDNQDITNTQLICSSNPSQSHSADPVLPQYEEIAPTPNEETETNSQGARNGAYQILFWVLRRFFVCNGNY